MNLPDFLCLLYFLLVIPNSIYLNVDTILLKRIRYKFWDKGKTRGGGARLPRPYPRTAYGAVPCGEQPANCRIHSIHVRVQVFLRDVRQRLARGYVQ